MRRFVLILASLSLFAASGAKAADVRIKDLGRFLGWNDNALVGYGLVMGLAGSGDSPHSEITRQAVKNVLSRLGANITADQVQSRNVAAVIVTATLPPSAHVGDKIDLTVSSIADARSLAGGTLLMTPMMGPDQQTYALAQGPLVVGGYRFDSNQNRQQKNYPAAGILSAGGAVVAPSEANLLTDGGLTFVLANADVTTALRICDRINASMGDIARVTGPGAIKIVVLEGGDLYGDISRIEGLTISPDSLARVVINERAGTVVAGADVWISSVVISQGDIKVSISTDNQASQPNFYAGAGSGVRSLIVTNTKLEVTSGKDDAVVRFPNTTVADLVEGLHRAHVDTRATISILQAIKAAGALHAEIIVQ